MTTRSKYSFRMMTSHNYYQKLTALLQSELPDITLQKTQAFEMNEGLSKDSHSIWLLDLNYLMAEQIENFISLKPDHVLAIGLAIEPEYHQEYIHEQGLTNILAIPQDYKDMAVNSWVGASFLVALNHTIQKRKKIIPFPIHIFKNEEKVLVKSKSSSKKYLNV